MKVTQAILISLLLPSVLFAVEGVPAGTTLPVTLGRTIDTRKARVGDVVIVKLAQDVPLGNSKLLRSGTKIEGRVLQASAAGKNRESLLTLRFDRILGVTPAAIVADLRAIASPLEVNDAKLPATGPDRGTSSAVYTTVQVGGDVVYRGGGPVMHADEVVGKPVYDGVLVRLQENLQGQCRGEMSDAAAEYQATYIFSASACGAYGMGDLEIAYAGRTIPQGQIVLKSKGAPIKLRAGTAMLLRVTAPPTPNNPLSAQ
jgi:hypothetical protein